MPRAAPGSRRGPRDRTQESLGQSPTSVSRAARCGSDHSELAADDFLKIT